MLVFVSVLVFLWALVCSRVRVCSARAQYRFVTVWVQFPLMVFVGLLGGASYVNCFYWVLHDKKIQDYHRDLCMNLCSFCTNTGILMASLFDLFMDHTFLS